MAGIVVKKKKSSVLSVMLVRTYSMYLYTVLLKVLVLYFSPSHRRGYVLVPEKFQSTCSYLILLPYFAKF